MSIIHVPKRPEIGFRQLLPIGALLVAMAALFLRLWYLQVVRATDLSEWALAYDRDYVPRLAPRGLIVDRNGVLLAGVKSEWVVTVVPGVIAKDPSTVNRLASILGADPIKLQQKIDNEMTRKLLPVIVYTGATIEQAARIAETRDELVGVDVEEEPLRYYVSDKDFSQVLGYVSSANDHDIARLKKQGIRAQDLVGKLGIESYYERELMGTPGTEEIQLDARKRPVLIMAGENSAPGAKLRLTIDSKLQEIAMQDLAAAEADSPGSGGAAVAIDPKTGEVLCLASNPSYSANEFDQGIKSSEYEELVKDPMKPLFDRAIAGAYSPGSTFKIVSTLAAAEKGTFDPGRTVFCPGYYQVGNRRVKCLGHHGAIQYVSALEKSCNTYFADQAIRTGPDVLRAVSLQCGLGRHSGIDIPGEGRALVPTDDWLRSVQHRGKNQKPAWYPGDTVNLGIGQGELTVTPLQMADLVCLVANKGICYRPHVVKQIGDRPVPGGDLLWRVQISDEAWNYLHQALIGVIERGTGRRAEISGLTWAGKTGSTEHGGAGEKTHSWFVGYAPAENPKIAVAVLVERSGHGGEVSAPIAAHIVRAYLDKLSVASNTPIALVKTSMAASAHLASFSSFSDR